MSLSTPPAGWYQQADGTERFWSGYEWSDQVRPLTRPSAALVPMSPPLAPAYSAARQTVVPAVAPKSPGLALLASFFIPGLGQLINGDAAKGVLVFLGYCFSFVLMLVIVGFFTAFAIWVWAMVDAYQSAQRWNLERGVLS